jgi:hypothetical protein
MVFDLQDIPGCSFCVPLNYDSVARLQTGGLQKIVRVWLVGSPARTGIRFDPGFFGHSVVDEPEWFPFEREERKPVFQYKHEAFLFFFRSDLLRVNVFLHQARQFLPGVAFEPCAVSLSIFRQITIAFLP